MTSDRCASSPSAQPPISKRASAPTLLGRTRMSRRLANRGTNAARSLFGCSMYPTSNGTQHDNL